MTGSPEWISESMLWIGDGDGGDQWASEAALRGGTGTHSVSVEQVAAPQEIAAHLGLATDAAVIRRRRLVRFQDLPLEVADSYYPLSLAAGTPLAEARKIRGGARTYLNDHGYPVRRVREFVDARLATAWERNILVLPDPASLLVVTRVLFSDQDVVAEIMVLTMVGGRKRQAYEVAPAQQS